jgi:hypothetical protein
MESLEAKFASSISNVIFALVLLSHTLRVDIPQTPSTSTTTQQFSFAFSFETDSAVLWLPERHLHQAHFAESDARAKSIIDHRSYMLEHRTFSPSLAPSKKLTSLLNGTAMDETI